MKLIEIKNYLDFTRGQWVLIIIVVVVLEFFLNLWVLRTENTDDPSVFIAYWGFPFEAIKVKHIVYTGIYPDVGVVIHMKRFYEFLWGGTIANLLIYLTLSVVLVKSVNWIRDELEYRLYSNRP
jgi:hypothetical protein